MRISKATLFPIMLGGLTLLAGATCFPLVELDPGDTEPDPAPPLPLVVSIAFPSTDREVPQGTMVDINWALSNQTGSDALASIILRDRSDLTNTILMGGLRIFGSGPQVTLFDTSEYGGRRFEILVEVQAGTDVAEESAAGQITVNGLPTFEFTEPFEPVVLGEDEPEPDPNSEEPPPDPTVTIRWIGSDAEGSGTVTIFGDIDLDHESGNEFEITSGSLAADAVFDSFDWNGVPPDGPVEEETVFNLYAEVADGVNEDFIVEGLATITVPLPEEEEEEEVFALEITDPNMDTDFLTTEDMFTIAYTIDDPNVLVDLGVDLDDNHTNGNETVILFQEFIEKGANENSFDWDGTDKDGDPVPNGIYRTYLIVNRGTGTPQIVDAEGLLFRRDNETDPLIALTDPAVDNTKDIGESFTFRWRDDDPDETAVIRLTLDDDADPDEAVETDNAEIEILADRMAAGDGVRDTFAYSVPGDLEPGTYYIFAYIDEDGAAPYDHVSVAPGRLIVEDPDA